MPAGLQSFETRANYQNQDGSPLLVNVNASLDLAMGVVTWSFLSVDPNTGTLPFGVFDGLLPVNDDTGRGEGFVHFLVRPKPNLATNTKINEQALIVFDFNDPIITNIYTNTIDAGPPRSNTSSPAVTSNPTFTVAWLGSDDASGAVGSGIASYDIFVSDNGGPFTPLLVGTNEESVEFNGVLGHTYRFYSVATDNVGHVELPPSVPDSSTTVGDSYRNPLNRFDVDGNTRVNANDVFVVVAYLLLHGAGVPTGPKPPYPDVTSPVNFINPFDVIAVVSEIISPSGKEEFAAGADAPEESVSHFPFVEPTRQRRVAQAQPRGIPAREIFRRQRATTGNFYCRSWGEISNRCSSSWPSSVCFVMHCERGQSNTCKHSMKF